MHQIAKINHCETSILGGNGIAVKLTALLFAAEILSAMQKIKQVFSGETRLSEQRHESALRHITIVLRDHGSTPEGGMVINEVAARCVVEYESVTL
jgi:hypothetical protein